MRAYNSSFWKRAFYKGHPYHGSDGGDKWGLTNGPHSSTVPVDGCLTKSRNPVMFYDVKQINYSVLKTNYTLRYPSSMMNRIYYKIVFIT